MFEVTLYGVKKYMDATLVLENVTFQAYAGEKVGIVGDNGSGKSTILKLIAGVLPMHYYPGYPQTSSYGYDEGFVSVPKDAVCAYLEQVPEYKESLKVIDVLKLAFSEIYELEKKIHELELKMSNLHGDGLERILKQYSALTAEYEVKGGYDIEEKLNKICTGLKLDVPFLNRDFQLLSGGEKTTVLLGKLLMDQPDILLLDEPTNHLDMESVTWLEEYLQKYEGIVIMVSHDRYFLDNVVGKIVEIDEKVAISYCGNYSSYVRQKEENMRIAYQNYLEQQKKIASMEKAIRDLRDWAIRADNNKFFKRAASMQHKLDRMESIKKPMLEKPNIKLDLKASNRSGNETIIIESLCKRFDDTLLFKNAELLIRYKERVALIGQNGSGKTTLLKMLLGDEQPDAGLARFGASVKFAYLPQKFAFKNEEFTVLECFREDIYILEGQAREYLAKYMFYGNHVFTKVKHLSGGERIRLMLAKILFEKVNLLILDEPTNHLDITSIEELEETLEEFDGTVLFISHDRYLINKIATRVVEINSLGFQSYVGNFDEYRLEKEKQARLLPVNDSSLPKPNKNTKVVKETTQNEFTKNTSKRSSSNRSNSNRNTSKKVQLEKQINELENELQEIDIAMQREDLHYSELNDLYVRKEALSKQLELLMEEWLIIAY